MGHAGWACCSSCVRSKHKLFTNLAPIGEQFPSGHSLTEELARLPRSYRWPSLYPHRVGGGGGAWEGAHVLTYHTALNPGLIVLKALRAAPGREPWIKKKQTNIITQFSHLAWKPYGRIEMLVFGPFAVPHFPP